MRQGVIWILSVGLWPGAGLAGLEICNDTDARQSVAVGHMADGAWTSEGWWNIAPGACVTPLRGDLTNRYYYIRAETSGRPLVEGDAVFCTERAAFTIAGQDNCDDRGHARAGFRRIDTGETARHYTLRLTGAATGKRAEEAPMKAPMKAPVQAGPVVWESGLIQGQAGEPFTETARFQGCGVIDGAEYCAFHASGWKWFAWYGGPTSDVFLDRLQALTVGRHVRIVGDIVSYGDISVEIALSRVELPGGDGPQEGWFQALQGAWVSVDDPAWRIEVAGSEMYDSYGGTDRGVHYWRFAEGCDDAPPEAGPALLRTVPETQETLCYLPDRIDACRWEMFYAGRGNLLRFRRP